MEEIKQRVPIQESIQGSKYADASQPVFTERRAKDYSQQPTTDEKIFGTHIQEVIRVLKEPIKPKRNNG